MLATIDCANLTVQFHAAPADAYRARAALVADALREHESADCYLVTFAGDAMVAISPRHDDDPDESPYELALEAFADVVSAQLGEDALTEALNSDGMRAVVEVEA